MGKTIEDEGKTMTLQSQQPLHREEPEGTLPQHPLEVSHTTLARIEQMVHIDYDPAIVTLAKIEEVLDDTGYTATG